MPKNTQLNISHPKALEMTKTETSTTPATPRRNVAARGGIFEMAQVKRNLVVALAKLHPRTMYHNPVMFVVEVGTAFTAVVFAIDFGSSSNSTNLFSGLVVLWLFATIVFANFAEATAEGRGKAQADALRRTRTSTVAHRIRADGSIEETATENLGYGDLCLVSAGDTIPCDGEIIKGIASVDESAITGESAPVIRESGGDRSSVTGGTKVISDEITIRVSAKPGESFLDRMISLVEGADRQKTPNEIALNILLVGLTIILLLTTVTLQPFAIYSGSPQSVVVLVALLVCLIPTTIGALLSAIGIAGMDRLVSRNVLATSGRAVEAAGDCSTLLLDKTGTITYGNRRATEFLPVAGVPSRDLAEAAMLASIADETPEGRSIVELAQRTYGLEVENFDGQLQGATLVNFSATTRMSGVDYHTSKVRKGAGDAISSWVISQGGTVNAEALEAVHQVATQGGTPLVVAANAKVLGVIHLKDVVKEGMAARFAELRAMGIKTVMVTGDNPVTAATIAAEAGVDDFIAEATPEQKLSYIRARQTGGSLVAMTGDGTNDAPALAQADVGVAMNSGTQAAKEAGNMVDLDSDPTKLIEIVAIGKQLLITRGSLTTFSIANDVAKYFAIIPAMFQGVFPALAPLNVMHLTNPHSAILAAVIFNALIILALIPLALRGVHFRSASASSILRRNMAIYGLGGVALPFIGIKAIDIVLGLVGIR